MSTDTNTTYRVNIFELRVNEKNLRGFASPEVQVSKLISLAKGV